MPATKVAKFSEGSLPMKGSFHGSSSSSADIQERPAMVSRQPGDGDRPMNSEFSAREPVLLELCCGTAGVSAQLKKAGGRALGIDHNLNRRRLKAAAVKLDLAQPWVQRMILQEITSGTAWHHHVEHQVVQDASLSRRS